MRNRRGEHHPKAIALLIAFIFIVYGYYGYIKVPQEAAFDPQGASCPLGKGEDLIMKNTSPLTTTCSYSFTALLLGILILLGIIAVTAYKKS